MTDDFRSLNDEKLVVKHLSGDKDAFSVLIRKYTGAVYSVILSRIHEASAVEDLAQQTFLTAFKSIRNLKEPAKFGSWIYGIARNTCMDWFRENRRFSRSLSDVNDCEISFPVHSTGCQPDCDERLDELKRHLHALPDDQQEVLRLLYSEKMSYREIAELLEISAATVNKRLTLARNTLRFKMKESGTKPEK